MNVDNITIRPAIPDRDYPPLADLLSHVWAIPLPPIQYAQAFGTGSVKTHNDSENAPMLAINRKLGYKPQPGEYRLIQALA